MGLLLLLLLLCFASTPVFGFDYTQCGEKCRDGKGFLYDGCCYVLTDKEMTWYEAREHCKKMGGPLADLAAPLSFMGIYKELTENYGVERGEGVWVGASTDSDGKLHWVTGVPVSCEHVYSVMPTLPGTPQYCGVFASDKEYMKQDWARIGVHLCDYEHFALCEMSP